MVEMKFDLRLNRQKEEREDFGSPSMGRGGPRLMIVQCISDARAEWPASLGVGTNRRLNIQNAGRFRSLGVRPWG